MKRLAATLQFRRALRESRFTEAVAAYMDGARVINGASYWAQYRLGLYGAVARRAKEEGVPTNWHALLAAAVCSTAVGEHDYARRYLERLSQISHDAQRWQQQVVAALIPHSPALARTWSFIGKEGARVGPPDLEAALLRATGDEQLAAVLVDESLREDGVAAQFPELFLHAANLILRGILPLGQATEAGDRPALALDNINRYLATFGLEPVSRRHQDRDLGATNLHADAPFCPGERPLVTVIMAVHETADRVGAAIESLLRQTHRNLQVIVIDDASSAAVGQQVVPLVRRDQRVSYHRLPRNVGPFVAKDLALRELARGEFVTCHDSDDWSHPRKIEQQLDWILGGPDRVFSWSSWLRITDHGMITPRQCYPLLRHNPSSPLFRREAVINRMGGYDHVRTGADSEFMARLSLVFGKKGGRPVRKPLSFGGARPDSLMTNSRTGILSGGTTPFRLEYWEAWRHWHIECQRRGLTPRMPLSSSPRPFPVSSEQSASDGEDLLASLLAPSQVMQARRRSGR